jgi:hypothetical protein
LVLPALEAPPLDATGALSGRHAWGFSNQGREKTSLIFPKLCRRVDIFL